MLRNASLKTLRYFRPQSVLHLIPLFIPRSLLLKFLSHLEQLFSREIRGLCPHVLASPERAYV